MALPKKKELRKLTFQDEHYYWKATDDIRDFGGLVVTVGKVEKPNQRFQFDFRFAQESTKRAEEQTKPIVNFVSPKLITQAITYAIQTENWPEKATCYFKYENGIFQSIIKS